jgi:hypothetical protein
MVTDACTKTVVGSAQAASHSSRAAVKVGCQHVKPAAVITIRASSLTEHADSDVGGSVLGTTMYNGSSFDVPPMQPSSKNHGSLSVIPMSWRWYPFISAVGECFDPELSAEWPDPESADAATGATVIANNAAATPAMIRLMNTPLVVPLPASVRALSMTRE